MKTLLLALAVAASVASVGIAQSTAFDRLSPEVLDVVPPSQRVRGIPGALEPLSGSCRRLPTTAVRRRIVDVAVQEWGFFGFTVVDQTRDEPVGQTTRRGRRRWPRLSPSEAARVADSIAGYWTVTPQGSWIIESQNQRWNSSDGGSTRWRYPWSAAFVSWVMCEGGLGESSQFQRAVAHHTYIDQAIRARDGAASQAAFTAFDIGETAISPGDLLCSGRRPAYRTLADRRRQMGEGARSHCDVVVKLDAERDRILAIGGNVRGTVSLKLLPAASAEPGQNLRPSGGARPMFAHLKLRAEPIDGDALDGSPTMTALTCDDGFQPSARLAAAKLVDAGSAAARC
ncbi:MAG: DUF2272 domain-containing protein [Vicinamibacterales bacterium]|jgi:hypothetical protein|nr:DUF2272 domain-containing protein [Vicinamibacterales bacterium]